MSDFEELRSLSVSDTEVDVEESSGDEIEAGIPIEPYQNEPLAPEGYEEVDGNEDADGLTPAVLESRFEREVSTDEWCTCDDCSVELLEDAREYRCCREILAASGKLAHEGIENITCITKHPDFGALTNATVLEHVCPLFKNRNGRSYRFPIRGTRNDKHECLRATAYRWLVRWIFGHLGWDNSRPLPSCIYNNIRRRFVTGNLRGYASSHNRR